MNKIIEILEEIKKYYSQPIIKAQYEGAEAIQAGIDAIKAIKEAKDTPKTIVDKYADLMLPPKERLDELEWMIKQSFAKVIQERDKLKAKLADKGDFRLDGERI